MEEVRINQRLLLIRNKFVQGSAASNRTMAYARGFAELGVNVDLFFIQPSINKDKYNGQMSGVTIHYLWHNTSNKAITKILSICRLFKAIKKRDIVFFAYYIFPITYILSMFHKNIYVEETELTYREQNNSILRKTIEMLTMSSLKRVSGLFVITTSLRDYYIGRGIEENKIHIINMFVDKSRFEGSPSVSNENVKCITYCGSLYNYKDGIDILLEAFSAFHLKYPEYKLVIIGDKSENEKILELDTFINIHNLTEHVVFLGMIPSTDIPDLLINSSILALARPDSLQAKYGFPTKLGEYLATGKPVIVTNTGDIGKLLKDQYNCIFAEAGSVTDFSEKLLWIADNYDSASQIAIRGQELTNTIFSYKEQATKVLRIMKDNYRKK